MIGDLPNMIFYAKFFKLLFLFLQYVGVDLLEVDVQFPENVAAGETATLGCIFDCNVDQIYTVKWSRGNREFYRYMPSEDPAVKVFPFSVGGIEVDIQKSNASYVTLKNVSTILSGKFVCEVTAGENLTTVAAYSNLYIYNAQVFKKPSIKYEETEHKILCTITKVEHSTKNFSTTFYSDSEKIDQKLVTYDDYNNVIILDTHLLDWNNSKSKVIHCEVDLPGTIPISSDEIMIENYTSSAVIPLPSMVIISMWWIFST